MVGKLGSEEISGDDKLMSLLCHLAAAFGSIVLPAVIYFIYRKKSGFVSFNALQALYYQITFFILTFLFSFFMTIFLLMAGYDISPGLVNLIVLGLCLIIWGIEVSYAVYIGIKTFKGEIIMYFIVGSLAFDRVYENSFKDSFNLERKNKPVNTYPDPPPAKDQGNSLL